MASPRALSIICPTPARAIEAMMTARTASWLAVTSYQIRFVILNGVRQEVINQERAGCAAKCTVENSRNGLNSKTDGSDCGCDGTGSVWRSKHSRVAGSTGQLSKFRIGVWRRIDVGCLISLRHRLLRRMAAIEAGRIFFMHRITLLCIEGRVKMGSEKSGKCLL